MNTTRQCPQCQQPLPADAPDGLCPQCLLHAAAGPPPAAAEDGLSGDMIDIADPVEVAKKLPQFEIIELLGRGGMGVVYKARQLQLDRVVALKILPPVDALSPDFVARFSREARSLARLNHENIVHVYDFGETNGLYYIVMEFVDGANLRKILEDRKLTPAEALAIVPKICDALEYAHEEGLVHRDIKPENLLIDKKGRVKVADFGLAKLLRREPLDLTLTLSGMSLGTLRYMAPEQMDKPDSVDHRADIYSLGVVIYEMLTGDVPVGHFALPSQKAHVDVRLDKIVLHALERDVALRYQQASEVRDDVEKVKSDPLPAVAAAGLSPAEDSVAKDEFTNRGAMENSASNGAARLSRAALCGAIWIATGVPAAILVAFSWLMPVFTVVSELATEPAATAPRLWIILIGILSFLLAASATFGATILGGIAIRHIKQSRGRIYGLPLAVADLLFYPLLLLAALIIVSAFAIARAFGFGLSPVSAIGVVVIALATCFFVALVTWRKINGTVPSSNGNGRRVWRTALLALLCLAALVVGFAYNTKYATTNAGSARLITVGAFDPVFVAERGPGGSSVFLHPISWSFFAIVVAGVALTAVLRLNREDKGAVGRESAGWRGWWKVAGVGVGLLLLACIIRTAMKPDEVLQPVSARTVSERILGQTPPPPSLGTITNGIGAQFTVPAGQVAIFEVVTRRDNATVALPKLAGYAMAGADHPVTGTFRWSREPQDHVAGVPRQPWRIEVRVAGGGMASAGGLNLPEALEAAVGAQSYGLALEPDRELIQWGTADTNRLPRNGLIGLRVRTLPHGFTFARAGAATTDWMREPSFGKSVQRSEAVALKSRLESAGLISSTEVREETLSKLALESAASHAGAVTIQAIEGIATTSLKDRTAEECALALANAGEINDARAVAEKIVSDESRNRVLAAIARGK